MEFDTVDDAVAHFFQQTDSPSTVAAARGWVIKHAECGAIKVKEILEIPQKTI